MTDDKSEIIILIKKVLNLIKGYIFVIPVVVYYLGFIYLKGESIFFTNILPWNISNNIALPISHSLYFSKGIIFILKLSLSFVVLCYLYSIIAFLYLTAKSIIYKGKLKSILLKIFKKTKALIEAFTSKSDRETAASIDTSYTNKNKYIGYEEIIALFGILLFLIFCILYFWSRLADLIMDSSKLWYFCSWFYYIVFLILGVILYKSIVRLKYTKLRLVNTNVFLLISFICFFVFISIFTYSSGSLSFTEKLAVYQYKAGGFETSRVFLKDNTVYDCLMIDSNKDYFIGFDPKAPVIKTEKRQYIIIPSSEIKKIEMFSHSNGEDFEISKYNTSFEPMTMPSIVNDYYNYRVKNLDAIKVVSLYTRNLYQSEFKLTSTDIIQSHWESRKEYSDQNIEDFLGVEMSIPEKHEGYYIIYVKEYWKYDNFFKEFTFISQDGIWKIDKIEDSKKFVKFTE
jgi:hypothetical protein